jgi:hypothetical protein
MTECEIKRLLQDRWRDRFRKPCPAPATVKYNGYWLCDDCYDEMQITRDIHDPIDYLDEV